MPASGWLGMRIDPAEMEAAKAAARSEGVTLSEWVRLAMRERIERAERRRKREGR